MSNNIYIGIDPGKNGGIAKIIDTEIIYERCPKDVWGMYELLESMVKIDPDHVKTYKICVYIEHVHSFPKQGVVSTFSFGQNYGRWEGIIASIKPDDFKIVSPQKWMAYYNTPKGLTRKERKRFLMDEAKELYPDRKITYNVSDAILIANYCKQEGEKDG